MTEDDLYPRSHPEPASRRLAIRAAVFDSIETGETAGSRTPRRFLALAVVATCLGVLLYGGIWSQGAAAWSATPDAQDASSTIALADACEGMIIADKFPITIETARPLVAEARGTSHAVFSAGPTQLHLCVSGPVHNYVGVLSAESIPSGAAGIVDAVAGYRNGGDPLRIIAGRLNVGGSVIVTTSDGVRVTASVGGGAFLAWWPSNADPLRVDVTLQDGTTTQIPVPPQNAPTPMATSR